MRFAIYVRANARRALVGGSYAGCLVVKVTAPAVDGAANTAVIEALARAFGVSKRSVQILQGRRSHRKLVGIEIAEDAGTDVHDRLRGASEKSRTTGKSTTPDNVNP
jgi:uncharacterized protein (TIGR00251 family)